MIDSNIEWKKYFPWLLIIFGFASVSIFIIWVVLYLGGEHVAADEVKSIPSKLEDIKESTSREAESVFIGELKNVNEKRKEDVLKEDTQSGKFFVNFVYGVLLVALVIAILKFFGYEDQKII